METKKKKTTTRKKRSAAPKRAKKKPEQVLFSVWFSKKVFKAELKFWQEAEIKAFFKDKGLSDKEEPDKYEECLKLY